MKNFCFVLPLLLLLVRCDSSELDGTGFSAKEVAQGILLINHTGEAAYYAVFGTKEMATIRWAPSVEGDNVLGNRRIKVIDRDPYDRNGESQVMVFWWQAVRQEGRLEPGEVQQIVLTIRS